MFITKKLASEPVTLTNIAIGNFGVNFYNSYRGSKIVTATEKLNFFKADDVITSLKQIFTKQAGRYTVVGCIKWITEAKTVEVKNEKAEKLMREAIIMDESETHILITVWNQQTIQNLEEERWYKFKDITLKDFYGENVLLPVSRAERVMV